MGESSGKKGGKKEKKKKGGALFTLCLDLVHSETNICLLFIPRANG